MFNGGQIREMRKEKNISLKELAQKAGVSVSYLSEIERDHKKPSLKTIEKLSDALNIPSKDFVQKGESGSESMNGQCIHLGQRIRLNREEKGMLQKDLSNLTGLSLSYICEIEKGNVFPSVNALNKIASALEIPVKNLMGSPGSLGERLRNIREEQGLNQAQLAQKTDLSPGLIGQLEQGKVQPSLKTLEKLSQALRISPCYLIAEEDNLQELLNLLSPEVRNMLQDPNVQAVLRSLRNCDEKEVRFILDFIKMFKQSDLCD